MERNGHLVQHWPLALLLTVLWLLIVLVPLPDHQPWGNWAQTSDLRWRFHCQLLSQPPRLLLTHQLKNISDQSQSIELFSMSDDAITVILEPQQMTARRQEVAASVCPDTLDISVRTTPLGTPAAAKSKPAVSYRHNHMMHFY